MRDWFKFTLSLLPGVLLLALVALYFTGCSHSAKNACQELDWYELGRRDGLKGQKDNERRVVKSVCSTSDQSLNEALYNNGFDAGIARFCTQDTGFELGRSGAVSRVTCPPLLQDGFNRGFEQGTKFSQLESDRVKIGYRLESLNEFLQNPRTDIMRRGLLKGEKIELIEKQRKLEAEMLRLKSETRKE